MAQRSYEKIEDFQGVANDVFGYCVSALRAIKASIETKEVDFGIIRASVGSVLGQTLTGKLAMIFEISVMPKGRNQTKVTVVCTQKMGFVDTRAQMKLVADYFKALDFIIQRATAAQQ
jgi:hypothetical protein